MTSRRLVLAAGLAIALAASCSHVLGADQEVHDVVVDMCTCGQLAFLGNKDECEAYLRAHLDGVTEGTRAAWIERYAHRCASCDTDLDCFYTAPTCATLSCRHAKECCSSTDGGGCDLDAGQCY